MTHTRLLIATAVATIALTTAGCAHRHGMHAQSDMQGKGGMHGMHQQKTPRVVIQVSDNDPAKWNLALNNANNVLKDLGDKKPEIEIVAYGPGIGMLKADATTANP